MTIETTETSDLATDSGDYSDEAAMNLLAAKRQPQEAPESPPEDEPAPAAIEGEEAPQEAAEDADDDPEYDLGDLKAKKSEILAWKAGEMKDADYRRKTAEAAEAKREAQVERDRIGQERSHYANHLDVVLNSLQTQLIGDQAQLAELARTDPAEWVAQNAAFQQRYADYQTALTERQSLANRMTAEQESQAVEWRKTERETLREKLPEWNDPGVAATEQEMVAKYLLKEGYATDDISNLFDHRALIVGRKAALWDQHVAAKASAKAKQVKAEPPKAHKPGAARDTNSQAPTAYAEALSRAKRTGSDDDAMALLQSKRQR